MNNAVVLVIAYLLGSLPIGLVIGKAARGIDVRQFGSGNIGASNVWRTLGPTWGIIVFLLDVAKGLAPTLYAHGIPRHAIWLPVATGLAAVLGHNFSPFLKFKGGKGVATTLGVALGLSWQAALIAFAVWGIALAITRYISLSSMIGTVVGSALIWQFNDRGWPYGAFAILASAFVIFTHRANIARLRAGTERRVRDKKGAGATSPPPTQTTTQ